MSVKQRGRQTKGLIAGCSCVVGARPWEVGWWTFVQAKVVQLSPDHKRRLLHTCRHMQGAEMRSQGISCFWSGTELSSIEQLSYLCGTSELFLKRQLAFKTRESIMAFHPLIWNTHPRKWERPCPRSSSGKICSITATTLLGNSRRWRTNCITPPLIFILISVPQLRSDHDSEGWAKGAALSVVGSSDLYPTCPFLSSECNKLIAAVCVIRW